MNKRRLFRCHAVAVLLALVAMMVSQPQSVVGQSVGKPSGTPAPTEPPARYWHMFASTNSEVVGAGGIYLFGGAGGSAAGYAAFDDFWLFDTLTETWNPVPVDGRTKPGRLQQAAFSCNESKCVLFGGAVVGATDKTWVYTRASRKWTNFNCRKSGCPSPRIYSTMAWDPHNGYFVLFGGAEGTRELGDTWTFDGVQWVQRFPANQPAVRWASAMAYISYPGYPGLRGVVMFGGSNRKWSAESPGLCDLQIWNGLSWQKISVTGEPGPCLGYASMFADPSTEGSPQLTVAGGALPGETANPEVWVFTFDSASSGHWTLKVGGMQCVNGFNYPYSYIVADPSTGKKVVFGGMASNNPTTAVTGLDICY